ncbi:hypothetical protein JW992_09285 [candidate division KSB1 bacterium]|nr:hypothetical protein [candidate division KSB1 bacterium]
MKNRALQIGDCLLLRDNQSVKGELTEIDGESCYKISHYDRMAPFLMSLVSHSDHWMFLTCNGGITAGRRNSDNALFPYGPDDKIYDAAAYTGSKTFVRVEKDGVTYFWEPFSDRYEGLYKIERNLYKTTLGNKIVFQEINRDLSLEFQYGWSNSDQFGIIKTARIINPSTDPVKIEILDGVRNILPSGLSQRFQMEYSTLGDAYKKSELLPDFNLAIYALTSIPTDKAEPNESLKATTVWAAGLAEPTVLLSEQQINQFGAGFPVKEEREVKALRGAYFICADILLRGGAEADWLFACEINQDVVDIRRLEKFLQEEKNPKQQVLNDIKAGSEKLTRMVANADGLQMSGRALFTTRHFSNVLFNIMRGGVFDDDYFISKKDFIAYSRKVNRRVAAEYEAFLASLPAKMRHSDFLQEIQSIGNKDLEKLACDYLPLTFSRRHGDPSRPWNQFAIETRDENGEKILNYQGNWRDIFQNWEALLLSFPDYTESVISKFLNASTADGYNPYRVTRDGFEWEVLDPNDPWSYIGYWGDHQVVYLLRLFELCQRYYSQKLDGLLVKDCFAFANVPYRIQSYLKMQENPHSTIDFDAQLDLEIKARIKYMGADGRFLWNKNGAIFYVNLVEKILLLILTRLSNFIPEAGIWMNTQRPEWNDANNALVGQGVSVVTLCYLRRFVVFCKQLLQNSTAETAEITCELQDFFDSIFQTLRNHCDLLDGPISDRDRKTILDGLGHAGTSYRNRVYSDGFSGDKKSIAFVELIAFFDLALKHIDFTIQANKRRDYLYHAYNLIKFEPGGSLSIRRLNKMLEGQVAVLSSGYLSVEETLRVLTALRNSDLFRSDQHSYLLYPDRPLPRFIEKNTIPQKDLEKSELLKLLAKKSDQRIIRIDVKGVAHFNGAMRNAYVLEEALDALEELELCELAEKEKNKILDIYERVFDHQSFTGRSGTFFKYEGLGSIYWHMVSKLLVAIQENIDQAIENGEDETIVARLIEHYKDVQVGIGVSKSPDLYGAFPIDPYSHTPAHTGAQQPGMTGQVKEDILTRLGELGLWVRDGKIHFRPYLLDPKEFLAEPALFDFYELGGNKKTMQVDRNALVFTFCQVPVLYHRAEQNQVTLTKKDGSTHVIDGLTLDKAHSASIFARDGSIERVDVKLDCANISQLHRA